MSQQIFVIHGGDAYNSYEEYIQGLKSKEFSLEKLNIKGWKANLGERLGSRFEVIAPRMPNSQNAKYAEWKIWFEKMIPFIQPGVILIGHSLGGIFLAKYLSENKFPHKIQATLLVAAPYNTNNNHPLADFNLSNNLDLLKQQAGSIILYHSKDDQVVPYSNALDYQKQLPGILLRSFDTNGHFNEETFPKLESDILRWA